MELEHSKFNVVIISKATENDPSVVVDGFVAACEKEKIPVYVVNVNQAWISLSDMEKGIIEVANIDGKGKKIKLNARETACILRSGAIENERGVSLSAMFESMGSFMVNTVGAMLTCSNKMASNIVFHRSNIKTPRTALLINEDQLKEAHESVGGKYPVVLKSIKGTHGIGVSIVESWESLVSVVQSLWKFEAELLIQEFLDIQYDVRTIVVDNVIVASTKRNKPKGDFRSNLHRGATTEPHELSDIEKNEVLAAARAMGAYMVGVDHAVVDKTPIILEINGSPGMESSFGLYELSRDNNEYKGKTTTAAIIDSIVAYTSIDLHRRPRHNIEAGYVESIEIDNIGPVRAKLDTGNGTSGNRFFVDKIRINEKKKVVEWEYENKKFTSDLVDISEPEHQVDLGERPVILLDIKFNNRNYKNIRFALTTEKSKSELLINRDTLMIFGVNINPGKRFLLSDPVDRREESLKK